MKKDRKSTVGEYFKGARLIHQLTPEDVVERCPGSGGKATLDNLEEGKGFSSDSIYYLGNFYGFTPQLINNILDYAKLDYRVPKNVPSVVDHTSERFKTLRNVLARTRSGEKKKRPDYKLFVDKYFPELDNIYDYLISKCDSMDILIDSINIFEKYLEKSMEIIGNLGNTYLVSRKNSRPFEFILASYSHTVYTIIEKYSRENRANFKLTIVDACDDSSSHYDPEDTRQWVSQTDNLAYCISRTLVRVPHLYEYLDNNQHSGQIFMIGAEYLQPDGCFRTSVGSKQIYQTITSSTPNRKSVPVLLAAQTHKVKRNNDNYQYITIKNIFRDYSLEKFQLGRGDVIITDHGYHEIPLSTDLSCCSTYWNKKLVEISSESSEN